MKIFHKILRHEKTPLCENGDPLKSGVSFSSGSSTVLLVSGLENRQPTKNPDYRWKQKTKPNLKHARKIKPWKEKFQEKLGLPPKKRFV